MSNYVCDLTNGYDDTLCKVVAGGIKKVIPVKLSDIDPSGTTITSNEVTALTATTGGYEFTLQRNLSSATYPPSGTEESGSTSYPINLVMVINNDTKEVREYVDAFARNTWVMFVQKVDGTWIALGLNDGLRVFDGSEGGTGTVKSDRNGYSISFTGDELYPIPDVDSAVIDSIAISS